MWNLDLQDHDGDDDRDHPVGECFETRRAWCLFSQLCSPFIGASFEGSTPVGSLCYRVVYPPFANMTCPVIHHFSLPRHAKILQAFLQEGGRCIDNRTIREDRRGIAPIRSLSIEYSQVPKHAAALAASRLGGKLVAQLSRNEMVMVPVLENPAVRNSRLDHHAGPRPICR